MTTVVTKHFGPGQELDTELKIYEFINPIDLVAEDKAVHIIVHGSMGTLPEYAGPTTYDATRRVFFVPIDSLNINKTKPNVLDAVQSDCILTLDRGQYGMQMKNGMTFVDMAVRITGGFNDQTIKMGSNGVPVDNEFIGCRFLDQSTGTGGVFLIGTPRTGGREVFTRCQFVIEGGTGKAMIINDAGQTVNMCGFAARGAALNGASVGYTQYESGSILKNLILVGLGNSICSSTITLQNCFSNTTPTIGQTSGVTVVGTNDLVENVASDYRIKTTSAAVGAAPDSEQFKLDALGNPTGSNPDVGPIQRVAGEVETAPVPGTPTRTIRGQRVRASVSFTGNAPSGTAKITATGGGGVTTETAATIDNAAKIATVEFTVVTPGNYSGVTFTLTNTGGSPTSASSEAFVIEVPVAPTITFGSPVKSGASVTFRGTYTGFPTSGLVQMPAAAVSPGAAVTRSNIPIVFADNGTWSASSPSGALGKYDPATATATNMTDTGNATAFSGFTLYALGTTPVGTPVVDLPPYSVPAFNSPAVAVNGKVTDVRFESTSGSAQINVPFSFGHAFKESDLAPGNFLVGKIAGQSDVPLQVNAMATHKNGSLKHAIISGVLPSLAANTTITMDLVRAASSTATTVAMSSTALRNAGFTVSPELTISGTLYTVDVNADMLAGFAADKVWTGGSVATKWWLRNLPIKDASNNVHPLLTAQVIIEHFPGANKAWARVVVENTKAYLATSTVTYDAVIKIAGASVYTKAGLAHYGFARWAREFWWNGTPAVHIKHNTAYLIGTKAVPNYKQSLVMSETRLQAYGATDGNTDPMTVGPFSVDMGGTGARPDIGLLPEWASATVVSMDKRAKYLTLASSGYGGSYQIHRRDHSGGPGTGYPLSVINFPSATSDGSPSDSYNAATGQQEYLPGAPSAGYIPDFAHQPSFSYLPYLLTGDPFHLEEMHFWAMWNVSTMNPYYRNFSDGSMVNQIQLRGQGWTLRTGVDAAYITPDNHPLKMHFKHFVDNTLATQNGRYTDNPNANKLGVGEGHVPYNFGATLLPATVGQTVFTIDYCPNFIEVAILRNGAGIGIPPSNYTATNGTTITLNTIADEDFHVTFEEGDQLFVLNVSTGLAPWMDYHFTSGVGSAAERGFTEAARLLVWKAKFPVGQMLAPGVCWINAAPYGLQVRDRADLPYYETFAEAFQKSADSGASQYMTGAMVGLSCNSQERLDLLNQIRPMPSEPFVMGEMTAYKGHDSYVANMQPALAYAVDSGYEDADLAWDLYENRANPADYSIGNQFDVLPRGYVAVEPPAATVPGAPVIGTALGGNGYIDVYFTAPSSNGGAAITGYTATLSTGETATGTTSPIRVTAANGSTRTATVKATNSAGTGAASAASNAVNLSTPTVITPPGAPVIGVAVAGNGYVDVYFAAPDSTGGAAITGFMALLSTGESAGGTASPIRVTAANGQARTATVRATNTAGTGIASSASNSVTPMAPIIVVPEPEPEPDPTYGAGLLSTYTDLQEAIASWLHRKNLTSRIPFFIALAEAKINRIAQVKAMEKEAVLVLQPGARSVLLPAGFQTPIAAWIDGCDPQQELTKCTPEGLGLTKQRGNPSAWAIDGTRLAVECPVATQRRVTLRYRGGFALSNTSPSNSLLLKYPDLYLYGALLQAAPHIRDIESMNLWQGMYNDAVREVNKAESRARGMAPLRTELAGMFGRR